MKKKILLTLGIIIALAASAAVGFAVAAMNTPKHPSDYKIGISYEKAVESEKPMLALFYVDWCGYCMKFMPRFKSLSGMYKNKYNFVMINVEDEKNKALVDDVGISGFPTVYVLDPKYDNRVLMANNYYQNIPRFKVELDRYLRIRSILDRATAQDEKK